MTLTIERNARFKIGDHVASQSGLVYVVLAVHALDEHGSFVCTVRRCYGGVERGPVRNIAECNLFPDKGIEVTP